ncbi:hypothetical protein CR3_2357 [Cupriavidus gilardii CR3]|nr:DUF3426 domain-containing protein [Cupriavidus gilardii]ALD91566.1 hypothetical protein CR3_2357 [Cupriavidus gilardii CR3]MCT9012771.1 DUF3426 domain-containing protein [Cupriavidus gilardii]MCT9054737.1 DUF3426 domain-containing protein [Cupriavidus gilardii]UXC36470.1 DUF3426 domain-containing protein [Cupriavidus gilardii]WNG70946.1 DUF3426 domain-containing protein [Cupriavidus gilardii]
MAPAPDAGHPEPPEDARREAGPQRAGRDAGTDTGSDASPAANAGTGSRTGNKRSLSAGGYLRARAVESNEIAPSAIAREQAMRRWQGGAAPDTVPFSADLSGTPEEAALAARRAAARRRRLRWAIGAAALATLLALLAAALLWRTELAARAPALRPWLEAACAPLGCRVPPAQQLAALRIDGSQLQMPDAGSDDYLLTMTLRNESRALVALPAIELVLTDAQDRPLQRLVLMPADYLPAAQRTRDPDGAAGLQAGAELPLQVRFRTRQAADNYRVSVFYP